MQNQKRPKHSHAASRSDRDPVPERQRRARSGQERWQSARPSSSTQTSTLSLPSQGARAFSLPRVSASRLLALALVVFLALAAGGLLFAQESVPPSGSPAGASPQGGAAASPAFDLGRIAMSLSLVLILILINAFLSMAEIALITVRKTRIRQLAEEGSRSAQRVEEMLAHPTRLMATIQTGVTLLSVSSAAIAAISVVPPLTAWIRAQSSGFLATSALIIALAAVALPVAVLSLVLGEIMPKSLAVRYSERLALLSVSPIYWLQRLLSPVVAGLIVLSNLIVKPLGGTVSFTTPAVNEEELKMMVEASEEQGVLEAGETEMIHSILNFADTVARRVMTPRIDMTALDANATVEELVQKVTESGHSRIPVYEGSLDHVVGIVHAKDVLALPYDRRNISLRNVMRPAYIIPETKKVDELLAEFRRTKQQLAIVNDEYGVTSGLITIEDLLEEIVGEIQDEYDEEEPPVQVINAQTSILDGKMSLRDVNERMGLELPEDEADTIGGFIFGLLGHQAEQGESAAWDGVEFRVDATDGRRIQKVRLTKKGSRSSLPDLPAEEKVEVGG